MACPQLVTPVFDMPPPITMNAITKPMLATKCECPAALRFPVLATPKLDGIRCLKLGGKALTL